MSQKTSFQAIFTPEPEGGFTATVPALPLFMEGINCFALRLQAKTHKSDLWVLYIPCAAGVNRCNTIQMREERDCEHLAPHSRAERTAQRTVITRNAGDTLQK